MRRYKIIRETIQEADERGRKYDAARRVFSDPKSKYMERHEAHQIMWQTCLGPAPRRVKLGRCFKVKHDRTHPCG